MNITKLGKLIGDWSKVDDTLLQQVNNLFKLKDCDINLDIQKPNNVAILTTDNLTHYCPENTFTIKRIRVHLTDWKPGHFYCYNDEIHSGWSAGDVYTYDWQKTSYASANAGNSDRVILELTGVLSEESNDFLYRLKRFDKHHLELKENTW